MANYIPFVNSKLDCRLLKTDYNDSKYIRLALSPNIDKIWSAVSNSTDIWIDPAMDIYHNWTQVSANSKLERYYGKFGFAKMGDPTFQSNPDKEIIAGFVEAILNESKKYGPSMLSVPQLPISYDSEKKSSSERNKINKLLASATAEWKFKYKYGGPIILPVILLHQNQTKYSVQRKGIIKASLDCYARAQANGIWIVDVTVEDFKGNEPVGKTRLPSLIKFHTEIKSQLPSDSIVIAGPYWGANLILWTRNLATYPATGLGANYQYHIAGGFMRKAKSRIAIPPLRRLTIVNPKLRNWLGGCIRLFDKGTDTYKELHIILDKFEEYIHDTDLARSQVASFYKRWIDMIENTTPKGRSLALFQDLSKAFVIGKKINKSLPRSGNWATEPWKVAKQLMLNCL